MFFTWALRIEMIRIKGHGTLKSARSTSSGPWIQKVTVGGFSKVGKKSKNQNSQTNCAKCFVYFYDLALSSVLHVLRHTLRLQSNADSFLPPELHLDTNVQTLVSQVLWKSIFQRRPGRGASRSAFCFFFNLVTVMEITQQLSKF